MILADTIGFISLLLTVVAVSIFNKNHIDNSKLIFKQSKKGLLFKVYVFKIVSVLTSSDLSIL